MAFEQFGDAMSAAHITASISGDLIGDVRIALFASLDLAHSGKVRRIGDNSYTPHAYSAYVSAVASIEAFVNETFLGWMCRGATASSALWQIPENSLERMDLLLKLVVVPQLLFGITFEHDKQPFQDFALLCRVRNDIVHFKMQLRKTPKYVQTLAQRRIALVESADEAGPWPWKLSSTEGIRWAHNSACSVAGKLATFIPEASREHLSHGLGNFTPIPAEAVSHWLSSKRIRDAAQALR